MLIKKQKQRQLHLVEFMLYCGYAFICIGLLVCIALDQQGVMLNEGMSYYGAHSLTMFPFVTAFILSALFFWNAGAHLYRVIPERRIALVCLLFPMFQIGIALTPYNWTPVTHAVHVTLGIIFFLTELVVAAWLALGHGKDSLRITLFILLLFAAIASFLSWGSIWWYLPEFQILFQAFFAALLFLEISSMRSVN